MQTTDKLFSRLKELYAIDSPTEQQVSEIESIECYIYSLVSYHELESSEC